MLYEIIIDCRINNKDYKKGDIVSNAEVEYFPSVMRPFHWNTKIEKAPKIAEKKFEEPRNEEVEDEEEEEIEEKKPTKKRSKKK